jgi:hypothetical protein
MVESLSKAEPELGRRVSSILNLESQILQLQIAIRAFNDNHGDIERALIN